MVVWIIKLKDLGLFPCTHDSTDCRSMVLKLLPSNKGTVPPENNLNDKNLDNL